MKAMISTRFGAFGVSASGCVFRLWTSSNGSIYRNDAGQSIPWARQWGVIETPWARIQSVKVDVVAIATQTQPVRCIVLTKQGLLGGFLVIHDTGKNFVSQIDKTPIAGLPGYSHEFAIAARDASVYLRRVELELDKSSGGNAT